MSNNNDDRLDRLIRLYAQASLHPIVMTVSPGRCGTVFLQEWFRSAYGDEGVFLHEHISAHAAQPALHFRCYDEASQRRMLAVDGIYNEVCWLLEQARARTVCEFGHYMISAVPVLQRIAPRALRVLVLHRHPLESASSLAIRGHYTINKSPVWAITPMHDRVQFPAYADRWSRMSAYEKELFRWLETTSYGLELPVKFPSVSCMVVASRDLFRSPETRATIAEFCGFPRPAVDPPVARRNESTAYNLETMPIVNEWKRTRDYPEVIALAERLGYDVSMPVLEKLVVPYQRPRGLGAALRRWTGFWMWRRLFSTWRMSFRQVREGGEAR